MTDAHLSESDDALYQTYLRFDELVRGGTVTPGWVLGGPCFWYAEGGPQDRVMLLVDPVADTSHPLFDAARLRKALTSALGYEPAGQGVPFSQLAYVGPGLVTFVVDGMSFVLDLATYDLTAQVAPSALARSPLLPSELTRITPRAFDKEHFGGMGDMTVPESLSPDGAWFASVADHDIALRGTADGRVQLLTHDGTPDLRWDVETVRWPAWSPDAQRLVVKKTDVRGMTRVPTIHWLQPIERVSEVITLPAGAVLPRDEVWVLDVHHGRPVQLDLGDTTDTYVVVLGWLPDASEVLLARYDRLLAGVEVLAASPVTGAARTVMTETSETWLTNHHFAIWGTDTGFTMLPDGSGFLWRSERDGWAHLYHYDLAGALVRRLTSGSFPVRNVTRVTGTHVYFQAHGDPARPYDNHLYRVPLDGGPHEQLTEGRGRHTISFAPSGDVFLDTFSAVDVPPITVLRRVDGTLIRTLAEADTSSLAELGHVTSREFVVKAADGETDLWLTLHYPVGFDPGRKYPLVEQVYGGPQNNQRAMTFAPAVPGGLPDVAAYANYPYALAQLGFLVLTMDGRGTPGRSKAFHDALYRNWGGFEIADHAGAIRQLAEQEPAVDLDRVGITGASWGGHYAVRALVQAPDVYKAAIAEVPGLDSRAGTLYEPYLGMPADNAALYDAADVLRLAPQVQGRLLMTGGINDTGTQRDLFRMSEALIRAGIQHDTMIYPNASHGYLGASGRYNNTLKSNWFVRNLRDA